MQKDGVHAFHWIRYYPVNVYLLYQYLRVCMDYMYESRAVGGCISELVHNLTVTGYHLQRSIGNVVHHIIPSVFTMGWTRIYTGGPGGFGGQVAAMMAVCSVIITIVMSGWLLVK